MPNIMVIDDEKMIRAGIVSIIQRLAPHWQVSECKDAYSAVMNIPVERPDLMVIDIAMPGMDGLDLAHYLKDNHPEILKIMLTGNDKFACVQHALRAEVVDYLLKPVIREELMEALKKAERLIEERVQIGQQAEVDRRNQLKLSLLETLYGDRQAEEQLQRLLHAYGWSLSVEEYSLLLFIRVDEETVQQEHQLPEWMAAFQSRFREVEHCFACFADNRHLLVLSAGAQMPGNQMRQWWLEAWTEQNGSHRLIAGGGVPFASLAQLPEIYGNTIYEIYSAENKWGKPDMMSGDKGWQDQQNHIRIALETNDSVSLWHNLEGRLKEIKQQGQEQPPLIRLRLIHFLLRMLLPVLNQTESKLSYKLKETVVYVLSRLSLPGSTIHLLAIVSELESRIRMMASDREGGDEKNQVIDRVKDYIQLNYGDKSLNLATLSKVVHMNSNYLSDLFKEVTGENYLAYLTAVRMNHAKKLLRASHLKTYEIGDRVGYSSAKYFSKLFRQLFYMTPSEYRNRAEH